MNMIFSSFTLEGREPIILTIMIPSILIIIYFLVKKIYSKIKNRKVKFPMRYSIYTIKIETLLKIKYYRCLLIIKKWHSLYKRLINYSKPLIIVLFGLLIYAIMVFFYAKIFIDINYNIQQLLWDIKSEILTLLVITFFINITTSEKKRHEILLNRHSYYVDFMYFFEDSILEIGKYLSIFNFEKNCFYTDARIERVLSSYKAILHDNEYKDLYLKNQKIIHSIIKRLLTWANNVKIELPKLSLTENEFEFTLSCFIDNLLDLDKISSKEEDNYLEFIQKLVYCISQFSNLLSVIRYPWRKDFNIDSKIYRLIYEEKHSYILNDYYLSKLMDLDYNC